MPTHASVSNNWANNDNSNNNNTHSPGQGTAVQGAVGSAVGDTEWEADAAAVHERLWQMVWRHQADAPVAGRKSFTATPEYVNLLRKFNHSNIIHRFINESKYILIQNV